MQKVALFAFNGEAMCFIHVLLNGLEMRERGYEVKVIIEGAATKLIPELAREDTPAGQLYQKTKALGLIAGACKACSTKMGVLEAVDRERLLLLGEMSGHPSISRYLEEGYAVMTF